MKYRLNSEIPFYFQTPCCRKTYQCRFCHDANEDHVLQRDDVTKVVCANCGHKQGVEQTCQNCGTIFGRVSWSISMLLRINSSFLLQTDTIKYKYEN